MKHFRKSGGFTLVEMVVCIAIASLVTMAATTVLMLALRVNRQTSDTASQQNTVRALLTTMEKAATDGSIKEIIADMESWQLLDKKVENHGDEARIIFGFDSETQQVYTNGTFKVHKDEGAPESKYVVAIGTPVLRGVYASNVDFKDGLLRLSVETKEGVFESTTFIRTGTMGSNINDKLDWGTGGTSTREKFLNILISQYGSTGKINYPESSKEANDPTYYSEWYIKQKYVNGVGQEGWNADTPWCACYVSWALVEAAVTASEFDCDNPKHNHENWFAYVDEFMNHFGKLQSEPTAGDIVFFDWLTDDNVENPQHVGVVIKVDGDYIITIEGNSAGRVAMRRYKLTDERILGYGAFTYLQTEQ